MTIETEQVLRSEQDTIRITCAEAGCDGCNYVHRRAEGEPKYWIDGERATKAAFEEERDRVIRFEDALLRDRIRRIMDET